MTSAVCPGCSPGMVLVTEQDCQAGTAERCLPTCPQLSSSTNCSAACEVGKTTVEVEPDTHRKAAPWFHHHQI